MNPYFNSINGWGGGFIAFWPSGGAVVETFGSRSGVHRGKGVGTSGVIKKNVTVGRGNLSEPTSEE